jgi:hypothetical protein
MTKGTAKYLRAQGYTVKPSAAGYPCFIVRDPEGRIVAAERTRKRARQMAMFAELGKVLREAGVRSPEATDPAQQ